jgi:hypothetical protein
MGSGVHHGRRESRILSPADKRRLLGVAAAVGLLISLPLNLVQHAENHRLNQRIAALEIVQAAHGGRIATAVPGTSGTGQTAGLPPRAEGTEAGPLPAGAAGPSDVTPATADEAPQVTGAVIGDAVAPADLGPVARRIFARYPPDKIQLLTNSIALFPNGVRVVPGAEPAGSREVDPLAANLIHGFSLLAQGQRADAGTVFESILTACPQWPYGFYYLALATGRRDHMEQAEERLHLLEALGRATPEARLYHALAGLFLGNDEAVKVWLATHEAGAQPLGKMMLGPLYVPKSIPAAIRRRLETVEGLPLLQMIDTVR